MDTGSDECSTTAVNEEESAGSNGDPKDKDLVDTIRTD